MKTNTIIILLTIFIICVIGAVEAILIFGEGDIISLDTGSVVNDTTNETNVTNTIIPGNNSTTNHTHDDPEPNVEPRPPEEPDVPDNGNNY